MNIVIITITTIITIISFIAIESFAPKMRLCGARSTGTFLQDIYFLLWVCLLGPEKWLWVDVLCAGKLNSCSGLVSCTFAMLCQTLRLCRRG